MPLSCPVDVYGPCYVATFAATSPLFRSGGYAAATEKGAKIWDRASYVVSVAEAVRTNFARLALTKKDASLSSWLLIDERPEEDKDASEKGSCVEF